MSGVDRVGGSSPRPAGGYTDTTHPPSEKPVRAPFWLAVGLLAAGPVSPTSAQAPVRIYVAVPADARLEVDGVLVNQTGNVRKLKTPPLAAGQKGQYVFKISFVRDGVNFVQEHLVTVEAGQDLRLDLTKPAVAPLTRTRRKPSRLFPWSRHCRPPSWMCPRPIRRWTSRSTRPRPGSSPKC